eukprot:1204844-Karenia_brevis.AAC.1
MLYKLHDTEAFGPMKSKMCAQVRREKRARPHNRAGWGNLIEYCCGIESKMGKVAQNFEGVSVTRVTKNEN